MADTNETKYISQVAVQNETYKIKDAELRTDIYAEGTGLSAQVKTNKENITVNSNKIADIEKAIAGGIHYLGKTDTELSDGASPEYVNVLGVGPEGADVKYYKSGTEAEDHKLLKAGDMVIENTETVDSIEYIWNGTAWNRLGSTKGLGNLAFKNSVSAEYTPTGGVTVVDKGDVALTCTADFEGNDLSVITGVTVNEVSATASFGGNEITGLGASIEMNDVTNATGSFSQTVTPTGTSTVTVTTATGAFAGTPDTVEVTGTASGTCTAPTITATQNKKSVLETAMVAEGTETLSFGTVEVLSSVTDLAATEPTFSGVTVNSSGSFTPAGTVTTAQNVLTCNLSLSALTVAGDVTVNSFKPSVKTATVNNFTPSGTVTVAKFTPQTSITNGTVKPSGSVSVNATVPAHTHTATFGGNLATITAQ